jgi:hypothetical protein
LVSEGFQHLDIFITPHTHSPMINKKSIQILNKKYKREREKKLIDQQIAENSKNHFNYKTLLNGDIEEVKSPCKKNGDEKYKSQMVQKSRNQKKLNE